MADTVYRGKPCTIVQVLKASTKAVKFKLNDQEKPPMDIVITDPAMAHEGRTSIQMAVGAIGTIFISEGFRTGPGNNYSVFPEDPKEPPGLPLGDSIKYQRLTVRVRARRDLSFASEAPAGVPADKAVIEQTELVCVPGQGDEFELAWLNGNVATWMHDRAPRAGETAVLFLAEAFVAEHELVGAGNPEALERPENRVEVTSTFQAFSSRKNNPSHT